MSRVEPEPVANAAVRSLSRDPLPLRPWPLLAGTVAIVAAAAVFAGIAAFLAIGTLLAEAGRRNAQELFLLLQFNPLLKARLGAAAVSALYLSFAAATVTTAVVLRRRAWRSLVAATRVKQVGWTTFVVTAATLAYAAAASFVLMRLQPRHLLVSGPTDYVLLGTLVANLACLAPLAEELFFRGWLYTALRAAIGVYPAFVVVAAAFAAFHVDVHYRHMLLVLPLALALGFIRERTGSIGPTIALHAVYNLIIVAITLAAS